jgi:hypothetical protein
LATLLLLLLLLAHRESPKRCHTQLALLTSFNVCRVRPGVRI